MKETLARRVLFPKCLVNAKQLEKIVRELWLAGSEPAESENSRLRTREELQRIKERNQLLLLLGAQKAEA